MTDMLAQDVNTIETMLMYEHPSVGSDVRKGNGFTWREQMRQGNNNITFTANLGIEVQYEHEPLPTFKAFQVYASGSDDASRSEAIEKLHKKWKEWVRAGAML